MDGTPIVQGPNDPAPGFYVSTTAYADTKNPRHEDPRRYVNAAEINYTLHARAAREAGVERGDFCVVHSLRTRQTVFAIVGDSGNSSGAKGLSASATAGLSSEKRQVRRGRQTKPWCVPVFCQDNPGERLLLSQAELDAAASQLDLDTDFSPSTWAIPADWC